MNSKNPAASGPIHSEHHVRRLVRWMTGAAWTTLLIGLGLGLAGWYPFTEQNVALMVGLGFMVASVHIYVIRTAIHLVHARTPYAAGHRE